MKTLEYLTVITKSLWNPKNLIKSGIVRNTTILLGGDASARIISLLALTITVRTLGTESFGILILAETYAKLFDRIFTFQSWAPIIRFGSTALGTGKPDELCGYIRLGYLLDCASALTGFTVAYFIASAIGNVLGWNNEIIKACRLYSFLILFNATGTSIGVLRLTDNFSLLALQRFVYSILRMTAVGAAAIWQGKLISFLTAWLISECAGYVFLNLCAQYVLYKKGWSRWWTSRIKSSKKSFVTFALWTNATSTIDIPVKFLDIFFISYFVSVEAAGIYKIFQQVSHVLKKPTEPLIQVLYPHFSNLNAHSQQHHLLRSAIKSVLLLASAAFMAAAILSVSSPVWLPGIFGATFREYILEFTAFIFVQAYTVAATPFSPLIVACGLVRLNFFIQAVANTAFLFFLWLLGSGFGLIGVVASTGIHALFSSIFRVIILIRTLNPG